MADTHVTITGNPADDPELKHTPNGNMVANFRLAVHGPHRRWRGLEGR